MCPHYPCLDNELLLTWGLIYFMVSDGPPRVLHADLKVLGGLEPVLEHLAPGHVGPEEEEPVVRAAAAHVLGTAASNNVKFQQQLLDTFPGIFTVLVQAGCGANEQRLSYQS